MKKILLLSMPFGAMERPALGLSLLKARLTADGIPCDLHYPSFTFADLLGSEEYLWISSGLPYIAFAGDWCFTEALYGPRPQADADYIAQILRKTWQVAPADIARLQRIRSLTGIFLNHCLETIPWEDYALVGFTSTFEQNIASLALAKRIKERYPRIATAFGGANWEGEMGQELHRQFSFVDFVCSGEADESFPALVARLLLRDGASGELPPGIVYRDGSATVSTGRATPVRNLDALPIPDFSDYFHEWSRSGAALATVPTVLVETSRGCWWGDKSHCTFCGLNGASLTYRSKSATRALAEMRFLSDRWQTNHIEVVDNILDLRYFSDLLPALAREGRPWQIFYEVKANLTRAQLRALKAAGVTRIQPGIESLSDHVLKLMRKGTSGLRNIQLLKWCREYGIRVDWNILYGFPGETCEDYERTLELLAAIEFLDPPAACGPIRMDRFSPYFEKPEEFGLINVRPMDPYRFLYPFPEESLMRVAYHFGFDYEPGKTPFGYADDVIRFTDQWQRKPERGMLQLLRRNDGSLVLRDTRPTVALPQVELTGAEAALYEYCDEFRSFTGIMRFLRERSPGEEISEEGVRGFLESLAEHKLAVTDGQHWLSLAVRVPDLSAEAASSWERTRASLKLSQVAA